MPLGRTHDRITWWTVPAIATGTWLLTAQVPVACMVTGAYLFAGLMFGGDLDTRSVQYSRWGLLRWLWLPYQQWVGHRSFLSHGPLVGTIGRLMYLAAMLTGLAVPVVLVLYAAGLPSLNWQGGIAAGQTWSAANWPTLVWVVVGLELGAMSHSLSDWLGSAVKGWMRRGARGRSRPKSR